MRIALIYVWRYWRVATFRRLMRLRTPPVCLFHSDRGQPILLFRPKTCGTRLSMSGKGTLLDNAIVATVF
jgi:hypothetical protein